MLVNILVITFILFVTVVSFWLFIRSRKVQFVGDLLNSVNTNEKVVALTFDDGPMPGFTEALLKTLDESDIKATFFLVGEAIEKHPDLAKEIVLQGHQIGNHSFSHKKMIFVSHAFVKNEIERTSELIRAAGYKGDMTFRPPYGKKLFSLPMYLRDNAIPNIMWNIEPEKYDIVKKSELITDYVVKNIKPGSIILMHPMFDSKKIAINSVASIAKKLKDKGYKFVTVSELLKYTIVN